MAAKKMSMVDRARKAVPVYDKAIVKTADMMEAADKGVRLARDTFFTDKDVKKASKKVRESKQSIEDKYSR